MRPTAAIALAFAVLLLCTSCITRRKPAAATAPQGGQIIVLTDKYSPDTVDMGTLHTGERLSKSLTLLNNTAVPMAILSTETSCGCLSLDYPTEPLLPSQSAAATLSFNSAGYRYWLPRTLKIRTSHSDRPFVIVVTATIK